jgi:hypothetical protein
LAFWNAITVLSVSAPKMLSGRLSPFFVEIGIAKPRSISASCSTRMPSPWEPRRSGGLFVEARTMSGSLEKRAHWRAMAHPLSGRADIRAAKCLPNDVTSLDFDTTTLFTATAAGGGVSLLNAATHEVGHSLGLKHADTPNSIMFATPTSFLTRVVSAQQFWRAPRRLPAWSRALTWP